MSILYRKTSVGTEDPPSNYIYKSAKDLAKDAKFKNIRLHAKSGVTRCLGSALDAGKACGYDYRPTLYKAFKTAPKVLGDADNVVDAWDMLNASNNTDDITVIYDRERDGAITSEMLENLPLYAFIGTGDARGKYISKKNKKRISRHGIINLGFTEAGKPIIYDLGKFSEGIPSKYLKEINYIAVPTANQKYFNPKFKQQKLSTKPKIQPTVLKAKPLPPWKPVTLAPSNTDNTFKNDFLTLLQNTFTIN